MLTFAAAGALGGVFPEVCADEVSAACRASEMRFQLPPHHYLHIVAGVCEFASITLAVLLAWRRTRGQRTAAARVYRGLLAGAVAAYPLLGVAYLWNWMGSAIELIFFAGFTIMVLAQLAERLTAGPAGSGFRS
jgi:hypothetical protein